MKSSEISKAGLYWWVCPPDDGPHIKRGRPPTIVQVGTKGFGRLDNSVDMTFYPGDPSTYITERLPGDFYGPVMLPVSLRLKTIASWLFRRQTPDSRP